MSDSYDLAKLYDRLNLTGKVTRQGRDAVSSGGQANVWEGDFEGRRVAVKVIREHGTKASERQLRKRLVREVRAWSQLHHRNVLPLLGFIYGFGAASDLASLVSPWMDKGTASSYLEKRSVTERIRILTGMADGLCYLHRHDVVHGDLKGSNILINEHDEPCLADFGLSVLKAQVDGLVDVTRTDNIPGSVRWMARELFQATEGVLTVTYESDIWAFGMTALELLTSMLPYCHLKSDLHVIIEVHKGALPSRPDSQYGMSDELWDLCQDCWHENPQLRPSTRVIAKRLWELDLKCKLRSRPKRRSREPDSPDRENGALHSSEERLRKSPKLSTLAELSDECSSPATPLFASRALVWTPTPRSATMSGSSTPSSSQSTMRSSPVPAHASSNGSDFSNVDPRRLFTNTHSDTDVYTTLHNHHERRLRSVQRTSSAPTAAMSREVVQGRGAAPSEPSGLGLEVTSYEYTDLQDSDYATALVSPRHRFSNVTHSSPRLTTHPHHRSDYHNPHYLSRLIDSGSSNIDQYNAHCSSCDSFNAHHPSQWTYFPYTSATSSSYPLQHEMGPSSAYSEPMMYTEHIHSTPSSVSSYSDFLSPPSSDYHNSSLDTSPQEQALLSPHQIGPIFSDNFVFSEPTSILDDVDPLTISGRPRPTFNRLSHSHSSYHPRPPHPSTVDFQSLQQGVLSPALTDLSDVTPIDPHRYTPSLLDTPAIPDYSSFDPDSFDEGLAGGLSLFGGVDPMYGDDPFGFASEVEAAKTPTLRTPTLHDGPGEFSFAIRSAPQSPSGANSDLLQMPPTPRLSPLLSSF